MSKQFKPMLAAPAPAVINFPVLASPKLDGIRCIIQDGVALSRSLKPIPNPLIQAFFSSGDHDGLDGELIVGEHDEEVFRRTTSFVMKKSEPDHAKDPEGFLSYQLASESWHFAVFDDIYLADRPFLDRNNAVECCIGECNRIKTVPHFTIRSQDELDEYEAAMLAKGYEGVMVRSLDAPYKYGRSTAKEGGLLKVKRFEDAEATVIGVEERYHNNNEATVNALGATERSTCASGLQGAGDLGALRVIGPGGVEFSVGSGFTSQERVEFWRQRESLVGKLIKYQYFATGSKDKPRFPTFKGFRDRRDL